MITCAVAEVGHAAGRVVVAEAGGRRAAGPGCAAVGNGRRQAAVAAKRCNAGRQHRIDQGAVDREAADRAPGEILAAPRLAGDDPGRIAGWVSGREARLDVAVGRDVRDAGSRVELGVIDCGDAISADGDAGDRHARRDQAAEDSMRYIQQVDILADVDVRRLHYRPHWRFLPGR